METKYLETALAVARARSFTRVARARSAAQSTISRHIAVLEAEVHAKLFTRPPGPVEPTAAGRAFLPHAEAVVASVKSAVEKAQAVSGGQRRGG